MHAHRFSATARELYPRVGLGLGRVALILLIAILTVAALPVHATVWKTIKHKLGLKAPLNEHAKKAGDTASASGLDAIYSKSNGLFVPTSPSNESTLPKSFNGMNAEPKSEQAAGLAATAARPHRPHPPAAIVPTPPMPDPVVPRESRSFSSIVNRRIIRRVVSLSFKTFRSYIHHLLLKAERDKLGEVPRIIDSLVKYALSRPVSNYLPTWIPGTDIFDEVVGNPMQENLAHQQSQLRTDLPIFIKWANDLLEPTMIERVRKSMEGYLALGDEGRVARRQDRWGWASLRPFLAEPEDAGRAESITSASSLESPPQPHDPQNKIRKSKTCRHEIWPFSWINLRMRHLHALVMRDASQVLDSAFHDIVMPVMHLFALNHLRALIALFRLPEFVANMTYALLRGLVETLSEAVRAEIKRTLGQVIQEEMWRTMPLLCKPKDYEPGDEGESRHKLYKISDPPPRDVQELPGEKWPQLAKRLIAESGYAVFIDSKDELNL